MIVMGSKKKFISTSLIAVMASLVLFLSNTLLESKNAGVTISFLDVGQGDAALITNNFNQAILIDGGPDSDVLRQLDQVLPFYQHKITTILLTHPHADHLSGLLDVIHKYEINNIYSTGVIHTTPEYLEFLELIKTQNITFKTLKAGDKLTYEESLEINIQYPLESLAGQKTDNLNNSSLVAKVSYGKVDALFMGDLEKEAQTVLLKQNSNNLQSEIIKVSHHGSNDSVNKELIETVSAQVAVISVGKDNKFNHPSPSALTAYRGSRIYRTDEDGLINILIDKEKIIAVETD